MRRELIIAVAAAGFAALLLFVGLLFHTPPKAPEDESRAAVAPGAAVQRAGIEEVDPSLEPHASPGKAAPCPDAVTTRDMAACLEGELGRMELALGEAYAGAVSRCREAGAAVDDATAQGAAAAIKTAQEKWTAYRGAQCEAERLQVFGGTMHELVYLGCMTRLTEQRIADLDAMAAEPPEGVIGGK